MLRNVKGENVQAKLAELFGRMLEKKGAEVFEVEAAKAIAGLSAMIYMNLGPRPAGCDPRTIPGVVERDVTALLKRFGYQIIPADEAEPIGKDVAMLPEGPLVADLRNVVQPHLGGHRMIRMEVFYSGEMRDLFVDAAAVPKDLPRNERATAIYRLHFLSLNPGVDPESLPYMPGAAVPRPQIQKRDEGSLPHPY
jgi:hypothetical protein